MPVILSLTMAITEVPGRLAEEINTMPPCEMNMGEDRICVLAAEWAVVVIRACGCAGNILFLCSPHEMVLRTSPLMCAACGMRVRYLRSAAL